ncbi:MAG: hypothetical protein H0V77_05140 [Actinobacteria bacterium]|nr:hypothetical protein [Actinomycetota bacterium]
MTVPARNNHERYSAAWSLFCSLEEGEYDVAAALRAEYDDGDLLVGMLLVASYLRQELRIGTVRLDARRQPHRGAGTDAWLERERLRNAGRGALPWW